MTDQALVSLKQRIATAGFHVYYEYLHNRRDDNDNEPLNYEQVLTELLNSDFRKKTICEDFLPEPLAAGHSDGTLNNFHVVQVISAVNISLPSYMQSENIGNNTSKHATIQIRITDGHNKAVAVCIEPIPKVNVDIIPGSKLRLGAECRFVQGRLLLDNKNCVYIGGEVPNLIDAWRANRYALQVRRNGGLAVLGIGGGASQPPKFDFKSLNSRATHPSINVTEITQNALAKEKVSERKHGRKSDLSQQNNLQNGFGKQKTKHMDDTKKNQNIIKNPENAPSVRVKNNSDTISMVSSTVAEVGEAREASKPVSQSAEAARRIITAALGKKQQQRSSSPPPLPQPATVADSRNERYQKQKSDTNQKKKYATDSNSTTRNSNAIVSGKRTEEEVLAMDWPEIHDTCKALPDSFNKTSSISLANNEKNKNEFDSSKNHVNLSNNGPLISFKSIAARSGGSAFATTTSHSEPAGVNLLDFMISKKTNKGKSITSISKDVASWSCTTCTYTNNALMPTCEMCSSKRIM